MFKKLWTNWKRECDKNAAPVYTLAEINADHEELARHRRNSLYNLIPNPYWRPTLAETIQFVVDNTKDARWDIVSRAMEIMTCGYSIKYYQKRLAELTNETPQSS